jgi:hypothetical protein
MIRKLLMVAAVTAMPLGFLAAASGSGVAGAKALPAKPPVVVADCSVSATVNFFSPGLTYAGLASKTVKTTSTATADETLGTIAGQSACTGTGADSTITSKATKCKGTDNPTTNPACVAKEYGYDSWGDYVAGGVKSIKGSLKTTSFVVNGTSYTAKTKKAVAVGCDSGAEVGFSITGSVTSATGKGDAVTLTACLGSVSGSNLPAHATFLGELEANSSSPGDGSTVSSAQIDPGFSSVEITAKG